MKFKQIREQNYHIFDGDDKKTIQSQINALKYIDSLASISQTDISDWDSDSFVTDGIIKNSKNGLNKLFFKLRETYTKEYQSIGNCYDAQFLVLQNAASKVGIGRFNRRRRELSGQLERLFRDQYTKSKKIAELNAIINKLENKTHDFKSEIDAVVSEGFWEILEVNEDAIILSTVNDVILNYKNSAQAVNLSVNMGKFKAEYYPSDIVVFIKPHENNIILDSFCHPHFYSDGDVCWGELHGEIANIIAGGDLEKIFEAAKGIITNYNEGSPYRTLCQFRDKRKRMDERVDPVKKNVEEESEPLLSRDSGLVFNDYNGTVSVNWDGHTVSAEPVSATAMTITAGDLTRDELATSALSVDPEFTARAINYILNDAENEREAEMRRRINGEFINPPNDEQRNNEDEERESPF